MLLHSAYRRLEDVRHLGTVFLYVIQIKFLYDRASTRKSLVSADET